MFDPVSFFLGLFIFIALIIITVVAYYRYKDVQDSINVVVTDVNAGMSNAAAYDLRQQTDIRSLQGGLSNANTAIRKTIDDLGGVSASFSNYQTSSASNFTTKKLNTDDIVTVNMNTTSLYAANGVIVGTSNSNGFVKYDQERLILGMGSSNLMTIASSDVTLNNTVNVTNGLNIKGGKSVHNPENWDTNFNFGPEKKNYIRGDTEIMGNTDNMGTLYIKGGVSEHNKDGLRTAFAWEGDNKNHIRGDTIIFGDSENVGKLTVKNDFCINSTCINEDNLKALLATTTPTAPTTTTPAV